MSRRSTLAASAALGATALGAVAVLGAPAALSASATPTVRTAALSSTTSATPGALPHPAPARAHVVRTLNYRLRETDSQYVDSPPKGQGSGDLFVSSHVVRGVRHGGRVGRASLACTVADKGAAALCTGGLQLRAGTIVVSGIIRNRSNVDRFAVVGGTGRYAGVRGTATTRPTGEGTSALRLTLVR